jgi:hypothetical protein
MCQNLTRSCMHVGWGQSFLITSLAVAMSRHAKSSPTYYLRSTVFVSIQNDSRQLNIHIEIHKMSTWPCNWQAFESLFIPYGPRLRLGPTWKNGPSCPKMPTTVDYLRTIVLFYYIPQWTVFYTKAWWHMRDCQELNFDRICVLL